MTSRTEYREKFQRLLRELFQFDCADLDFGIYRIMNYKREVIEKFITVNLPDAVGEELDRGILAEQSQAAEELNEVSQQIGELLGRDALDVDGNLSRSYHDTPLGEKYQNLRAKAADGRGREALEVGIFNHLYTFFSRYYQDGDFISKRRYSKRQRYAIPYNGEEVFLYWANYDQYYVKSAEHFHDYTFTSRGVTTHFKLRAASVEQNNVKGDKRFFLPRTEETTWDDKADRIVIPFEYRPLTEQEAITYGKKHQQEAIIVEALTEIPERAKNVDMAVAALMTERHENGDGSPITFLEHHLRQYTRRNTSDFFIHKDLKAFLSGELDYYLKNEVLNLDEMEAAGEERAEGWFQMLWAIKAVGRRIIDFLDQIERFQKMLWEKRKFVTETQYCITVGNIDESFYSDIASCELQWKEWKELFHIDEEQVDLFKSRKHKKSKRITFLKNHPTLVLDTKNFDIGFIDKILSEFGNIDETIEGVLIHSENFQALQLIQEKFQNRIKCIYIDPPYNTGNDEFIFKDNYKHSSWLTMINQVVYSARPLMSTGCGFFVSCDDHENSRLKEQLDRLFGVENFESQIIIQSNKRGQTYKSIAKTHEYLLVYRGDEHTHLNGLSRDVTNMQEDNYGQFELWELRNRNPKFGRFNRANLYFPIYVSINQYKTHGYSCVSVALTEDFSVAVYPRNSAGEDSCWRWSRKKVEAESQQNDRNLIAKQTRSGEWRIFEKSRKSLKAPKSIWSDTKVINEKGTTEVGGMGFRNFDFPKPLGLLELILQIGSSEEDIVLDFFAGTGTTAHAVINLNRADDGNRKFIVVEMSQNFDKVLLPRIKKIMFTPEWNDGKPKRMVADDEAERSPRIVKYMRMESYEDALNNIEFDDPSGQQVLEFDDYLVKYMLKWETRRCATLLNVDRLTRPFHYKLYIHADGRTREKVVDVPETFNYLLGLHVQTRQVRDDGGRRYLIYRGWIDHRRIVVIWREIEGWQKADLERDKKFVAEQRLAGGADEIFVSGDSFIPNARALEPVFKARMFAGVEA